jgi:hypothetical protein
LIATRGRARVELEEGGGILVDSNAPPPPPGSTPPRHATLHGSCGGDPLACSEAGTVVRRATTLEEVRAGLEPLGFTVDHRALSSPTRYGVVSRSAGLTVP